MILQSSASITCLQQSFTGSCIFYIIGIRMCVYPQTACLFPVFLLLTKSCYDPHKLHACTQGWQGWEVDLKWLLKVATIVTLDGKSTTFCTSLAVFLPGHPLLVSCFVLVTSIDFLFICEKIPLTYKISIFKFSLEAYFTYFETKSFNKLFCVCMSVYSY